MCANLDLNAHGPGYYAEYNDINWNSFCKGFAFPPSCSLPWRRGQCLPARHVQCNFWRCILATPIHLVHYPVVCCTFMISFHKVPFWSGCRTPWKTHGYRLCSLSSWGGILHCSTAYDETSRSNHKWTDHKKIKQISGDTYMAVVWQRRNPLLYQNPFL